MKNIINKYINNMIYKTLIRKEDNHFMYFNDDMIYEISIPKLFDSYNKYWGCGPTWL